MSTQKGLDPAEIDAKRKKRGANDDALLSTSLSFIAFDPVTSTNDRQSKLFLVPR